MARAPAGTDCNQRQGLYLLRVREAVTSNRRLQTPQYPVTIRDKFEFLTPLLQPPLGSDERLSWEVRENHMSQCKVERPRERLRHTRVRMHHASVTQCTRCSLEPRVTCGRSVRL